MWTPFNIQIVAACRSPLIVEVHKNVLIFLPLELCVCSFGLIECLIKYEVDDTKGYCMRLSRQITRVLAKQRVKRIARGALEQQLKVLLAALSSIFIHRLIQYFANRFPRLRFLRMVENRTMRENF